MGNNPNQERFFLQRMTEWAEKHPLVTNCVVWFFVSIGSLYGIYEILDYFEINFLSKIVTPLAVFLLISIIIVLIRIIATLLNESRKNNTAIKDYIDENDSLITMLKEAEMHQRWNEIIKIGSALSDVLWFTSRKKLRVAIGHFVEIAATQVNDNYTLSNTLIEDLGNTVMGFGKVDEGIKYINRGIRIAEKYHYTFLIMRGYRNLANCYSLKNDIQSAEKNLLMAENAAKELSDDAQKMSALGAIEYARSKVYKHKFDYSSAIKALDRAIDYYNSLSEAHPETQNKNLDRLVKIYREKGLLYLKQTGENSQDNAYEMLQEGLRLAQISANYDNIIRCCSMMARIQMDRQAVDSADGLMKIARQYIGNVDTPSIISEYNEIARKLEFEKYGAN